MLLGLEARDQAERVDIARLRVRQALEPNPGVGKIALVERLFRLGIEHAVAVLDVEPRGNPREEPGQRGQQQQGTPGKEPRPKAGGCGSGGFQIETTGLPGRGR